MRMAILAEMDVRLQILWTLWQHYLVKTGNDKQLFVNITPTPVFMYIRSTFLKLVKEQKWTDSGVIT
jgi:hypothetical protein